MKTDTHTETKPAHTALPWDYKKVPVWAPTQPEGQIPVFEFSFAGGDEWLRKAKANTHFIVRACNSHYELVEACKFTLEASLDSDASRLPEAIAKIEAAIARATGGRK